MSCLPLLQRRPKARERRRSFLVLPSIRCCSLLHISTEPSAGGKKKKTKAAASKTVGAGDLGLEPSIKSKKKKGILSMSFRHRASAYLAVGSRFLPEAAS
jgi:hypothetical protein